ncbi:hypothetical protein NST83_25160 [Paenibacillus sp. FSL R10-2782]
MNADHQDPGVRRENQVQRAGRGLEHTASGHAQGWHCRQPKVLRMQ